MPSARAVAPKRAPPTAAALMESAVSEKRIISKQEANLRKAVGLVIGTGGLMYNNNVGDLSAGAWQLVVFNAVLAYQSGKNFV